MVSKEEVSSALKECIDPEIGMSVIDLGLIYDVNIEGGKVKIKMTLTTPGCPMGSLIARDVKDKISKLEGVEEAEVEIVWDPPWSPDMMSDYAKEVLRFK